MKILYIVPNINNEGGVARVLSIKANYLCEKLGYDVHILTQNQGNSPLFYSFNHKIVLHDMILSGPFFQFITSYRKALNNTIKACSPDIILVCDNGLKAFTIPFILKTKIPIVFECHSSLYIEEHRVHNTFFSKIKNTLKYHYKKKSATQFDVCIALSTESLKEWNFKKGLVIPNPVWIQTKVSAQLQSKKAIAVARNSYEKGLDRLVLIWSKVVQKHPDWVLEIYGKDTDSLAILAQDLQINSHILFNNPVQNIEEKYLQSSICVMSSRFEAFPMVLIEAMACGLPCVAYDCHCGPRAIITNAENGFLIEDGIEQEFVEKVNQLIENENLRIEMGQNAKESAAKYTIESIMHSWVALFTSIHLNKTV